MCTGGDMYDEDPPEAPVPPAPQEPLWLALVKLPWRYALARIRGTAGK
jgi:hypothetical protein